MTRMHLNSNYRCHTHIITLPENVLDDIVFSLSNRDKFMLAGTCRLFYSYVFQPRFWRDINIDGLEFGSLVLFLKQLVRVSTRLRSLTIQNCYSEFINNTTIPINSVMQLQSGSLYQKITNFSTERRRDEYKRLGFPLHGAFSDVITQLIGCNKDTLRALRVEGCSLDLGMTDLLSVVIRYGRGLEEFVYDRNHDCGIEKTETFETIIASCPNMRRFHGAHVGMNDAILLQIASGWPHLTSLSIMNGLMMRSRQDYHLEAGNSGIGAGDATNGGSVSSDAFYKLLESCLELEELELYDLDCIINTNFTIWAENAKRHVLPSMVRKEYSSRRLYHPYDHNDLSDTSSHRRHFSQGKNVLCSPWRSHTYTSAPGSSLKRLLITKFITTPLSLHGLQSVLVLFPNLCHLQYMTNFTTFDLRFVDVTPELIDSECVAAELYMRSHAPWCRYDGVWDADVTPEQKLIALGWIP